MRTRSLKGFAMGLVGVTVAVLAGCTDPLEPAGHPEAGGVVIFAEGTRNVLSVSVGGGGAFNNPLTVPLNGVLEVEVLFLDRDDPTNYERAYLPDEDELEAMRVTVANESIARFNFHGDHGDFEGRAAGTTTATFDLLHGGHSDFATGNLTIVVQ